MGNIPLPALDIRPPQPNDPLGAFEKLQALRSMANQQQIQQQQIQSGQQENQLRALQLQDQQTLRSSAKDLDWSKPDTFDKWIANAQQNGVSPQTLSQLSLQRAQYQEQLAKTDTATLTAQKEVNSQLQGHIDAIKGITDPTKRSQAAQLQGSQILQSGIARTPQAQQMAQALASGKWVPSDDDLEMFENGLTDHNTQIEQRLKQAETAKNSTEALLNQNKVDVINSWKQNPQQVLAQVDSIVPPTGPNASLNARTKSQVQFALGNGDVDGAKAAIRAAAEQVGAVEKDVAVATNPQIQQGKVQVASAEGAARAQIEHQIAVGGQAALTNVPTHLVAPATEGAIKAGTEYAQAKSVSDRLQLMMDAAKKGNVVSYQLIPQEGALQVTTSQGVHRINMAEIQNYGGGSLWQRLEGHIGKELTGESIPASVLKDMEEMQKIQSEGSRTKYENTLKTINQATGAAFKPVDMETLKTPATPGQLPKSLTAEQVTAYAQAHNVSEDEVKRQAKAKGIQVP